MPQCIFFDLLQNQGYDRAFAMNHDGHFGGFLSNVQSRNEGGLDVAPAGFFGADSGMKSFDDTPIYRDIDVLTGWWNSRKANDHPVALYYNSISLHDGNVLKGHEKESSTKTYAERMHRLFDDINQFIDLLKHSNKPVVLVMVSEHGAAIHGDQMQIQGMREIPSPVITKVPLAIKLIGLPQFHVNGPIMSDRHVSYLAIVDLLKNLLNQESSNLTVEQLSGQLPETDFVSANEDTTVLQLGAGYFIKEGANPWATYHLTAP
jgi:cellulose synthase operon protein YhjU